MDGADLAFGVVLNIIMTFGFGLYKTLNVSIDEMLSLLERYPIKPNYLKVVALWLVPYAGVCYIFHQLYLLQRAFAEGRNMQQYLEAKLSGDYAKQKARK